MTKDSSHLRDDAKRVPFFITKLNDLMCRSGEAAQFIVKANGIPRPKIQWFWFNQEIITVTSNIDIKSGFDGNQLTFKATRPQDQGRIQAVATNCAGRAVCSCSFKIKPEKTKEGEEAD